MNLVLIIRGFVCLDDQIKHAKNKQEILRSRLFEGRKNNQATRSQTHLHLTAGHIGRR
jgi:hypothetical protein